MVQILGPLFTTTLRFETFPFLIETGLNCAQMQDQLQLSHPNLYDITSVYNNILVALEVLRLAREMR